jgi:hypothetical protein
VAWNIRVARVEVLNILRENRKNHKQIVIEAWGGYQEAVVAELERLLQAVKDNVKTNVYVALPRPEDHTDEYDTIIKMLEMSTEDNISLGSVEFRSYIEDKWDWKDRWITTTAGYSQSL